ncbi:MAG: hypothetical protein WA116_01525 [Anaerolineaceae bacterium]
MDQHEFQQIIAGSKNSKKYRGLDLPDEMLQDLLQIEAVKDIPKAEVEQAFRKKLHNIVAPYLENINYPQESKKLLTLADKKPDGDEVKAWAGSVLTKHASTRERLSIVEDFYANIFRHTGQVSSIIDLACGVNPLCLPWMHLESTTTYLAYDIHKPRIDFLNQFFSSFYPNAKAIQQDVLVETPTEKVDCAFFFKEAHRFEKRQPGCNRSFFDRLNARTIVVSLPASDLSGHHSLVNLHSSLIDRSIQGFPWKLDQTQVGDELLFFIHKS